MKIRAKYYEDRHTTLLTLLDNDEYIQWRFHDGEYFPAELVKIFSGIISKMKEYYEKPLKLSEIQVTRDIFVKCTNVKCELYDRPILNDVGLYTPLCPKCGEYMLVLGNDE